MYAALHTEKTSFVTGPLMEPLDVNHENLARILGAASAARRCRMSIEEAFIFMAIGHLGVTRTRSGFAIKPVPCADIAQLLDMPRETVRRKAMRLVVLGLVSKGFKGVAIDSIEDWLDFVGAVAPK